MSGAQGQGGSAPQGAPSGDLAPMQQFQSYKSAPDRAAWIQQNQTQAQPVQPWQPPQRMYARQPMQWVSSAQKSMNPMRNAMTGQPAQGAPVQKAPMMALPTYKPGESRPAFASQSRAYDRLQNRQGAK